MSAVNEMIDGIRAKIAARQHALRGINATYQFNMRGEGGGSFYIAIANGAAEVVEGTAPKAHVTVTAKAQDLKDILQGKLDAEIAYNSGQLWIDGDIWVAQQLQGVMG